MTRALPERADVRQLRTQAKELLHRLQSADPEAVSLAKTHDPLLDPASARLADAQRILARSYGHPSWPKLVESVEMPDLLDRFRRCIDELDAKTLDRLLREHRSVRRRLNDPLFAFDAPALVTLAGREGAEAVLRTLVAHGADPNARSQWWAGGFGPLELAAASNRSVLVELGAEYDVWSAAAHGNLEELRKILDEDPSRVNAPGGDGMRPLHFASTPEAAELLISRGADLEARDTDHEGTPAQHQAARPEVLRVLLKHGAKPDIFTAVALDDADLARKVLEDDPGSASYRVDRPPFACVKSDGGHIYGYIFTRGATPLVEAARRSCDKVFHAIDAASPNGSRLIARVLRGDEDGLRRLLAEHPSLAADLDPEDARAIADAAGAGDLRTLRLLLEAGVDPQSKGMDGGTALHVACWFGQAEAVAMLVGRVPLDARDEVHGSTPLGWAAHGAQHCWRKGGDHVRTVEILLEAGAPVAEPANSAGTGILDQAGGRDDVKEVLRRYGAV
ncbi:MAG TPA: ankyrin repeat domain-containing protein [Fimbriimonas sp.]